MRAETRSKTSKARRARSIGLAVKLILCFPLGLYVMWTKTNWPRSFKTAVSAAVALVLTAILMPLTDPPEREIGGIQLVDAKPQVEVYGPEAPEGREIVEIYAPRRTAVLVEATPTPEPITVYCNNGGKYYHSKDCRYVKPTTPTASLTRALAAGYTKCPDCDAPEAD